jgi:hypothetical protein
MADFYASEDFFAMLRNPFVIPVELGLVGGI